MWQNKVILPKLNKGKKKKEREVMERVGGESYGRERGEKLKFGGG